jgi:2-polyprenyl-3-methyl-5-hydroxy-6-metoxy-1,4-benzoquinol methylase
MDPKCPLCQSKNNQILYKEVPAFQEADILLCKDCGHYFTFLRKEVNVNDLYSDKIYKVVENRNSVFDRIIEREYTRVIKLLNILEPHKGNLLDFGSGKGKFGSLAVSNGWHVNCVETSIERAEYARTVYGLEVNTAFYKSGNIFNKRFEVLTLFHVLEHLTDPGIMLVELIKYNLCTNGLVLVEVPNIQSWQSRMAKKNWLHLDVPRHIQHFSAERLQKFLLETGLTPVRKSYFSLHLGVLGMVDSMLKQFGYRKNIIYELKNKKNKFLKIKIAILLPIAFIMEGIAACLGKGGIVRIYSRSRNSQV